MQIKLSVSKIVDLILRCGDINNRFSDTSAMHNGSAAHRKIQKAGGEHYKKEVPLKYETELNNIPVIIQGRADGIIATSGGFIIDEIKTTTLPLDYLFKQHTLHLGQAKCYAFMYLQGLENKPGEIKIQLTYYHQETEEIKKHMFNFSEKEINLFFDDLMQKYAAWLLFEINWKIKRDTSIKIVTFPFPSFRKGQREMAAAVYRTIIAEKNIYATAPTGIGKTISTLFPAVKAMGEGKGDKLFYLTAKTMTRAVAQEAVQQMADKGLFFKSITLRAKDKLCIHTERNCTPDFCIYAKGHYDRINDALWDIINNEYIITPEAVTIYSTKYRVCPHEYALDIALWCDLIIGDYNHVFDPSAYLRRFFYENHENKYIFLFDEAHNVADRVRDMHSISLRKNAFSYIHKHIKNKNPESALIRKELKLINAYFSDLKKEINDKSVEKELNLAFKDIILSLNEAFTPWLLDNKNNKHELFPEILNMYFELNKFLLISDLYDSRFITLMESRGSDFMYTLFCLDPSGIIHEGLKRGIAAVFFSATLHPLKFYRDLLGGEPDDPLVAFPSPFDPARQHLIIQGGISTRYANRAYSYIPIINNIYTLIKNKPGNYLIFFPSYEYLNKVYALFVELYPGIKTLLQKGDMTEIEREDYLHEFKSDNNEPLLGFAVLGGIFSEGIDLKGNRLIGAIIISVGIPMINNKQDEIKNYFNQLNNNGYDYAYTFPGMNKILQAAGRVIRTETDEGIILLMDDRFNTKKYRDLFPAHWSNIHVVKNENELDAVLNAIWSILFYLQ